MESYGSSVHPSNAIVGKLGSLSYHIARLDTSSMPPDVESVKSDDDDESFFVVDRTWATLFRFSRRDCLGLEEKKNALLNSQLQELRVSSVSPSTPTANADWKTEKLILLGQIVDLENLNFESEARCKVLSKELEGLKAELLRLHYIAHNTSSVSCELPPLPAAPPISSTQSSNFVHALPLRGRLRPFQCAPWQGQGSRLTCFSCGRTRHWASQCMVRPFQPSVPNQWNSMPNTDSDVLDPLVSFPSSPVLLPVQDSLVRQDSSSDGELDTSPSDPPLDPSPASSVVQSPTTPAPFALTVVDMFDKASARVKQHLLVT
ncbi:hypothetical protein FRX31_005710 [Thalictrum thalictroides]|uniref:CCHC-type domain-containing protein n=1 Tax=Thalictrum thalictroides TaxID=46969 RepID=A0A7J6X5P9_THATH|nr:hypothetical protein FRX31_005710 [Thalictrum thalictroides]